MRANKFLQQDDGVVAAEYVVFVAAIGILLAVGVAFLINALGNFFGSWATYFGS